MFPARLTFVIKAVLFYCDGWAHAVPEILDNCSFAQNSNFGAASTLIRAGIIDCNRPRYLLMACSQEFKLQSGGITTFSTFPNLEFYPIGRENGYFFLFSTASSYFRFEEMNMGEKCQSQSPWLGEAWTNTHTRYTNASFPRPFPQIFRSCCLMRCKLPLIPWNPGSSVKDWRKFVWLHD